MLKSKRQTLYKKHSSAVARLQRRGIDAAKKASFRIVSQSIKAYRQGRFSVQDVLKSVQDLKPLLLQTMVISHLTGLDIEKKQAPIKLELVEDAIDVLKKRHDIDLDELINTYDYKALEALEGCSGSINDKLDKVLEETFASGAHVQEGVDNLRVAFDDLGLTPDNSYTLENIFRTQSSLAFNAGKWEGDQDPAIQEVLWGYVYSTVGDDRVRESHRELEGVTASKDSPIWDTIWPPNGWSCRCTCIPLYEPEEEQVPDDATLEDSVDDGFDYNAGKLFA